MRASLEAIPREIEEAAVIDGCSTWQRLTRVFLPLAVPGLVTVALFAFINSRNESGALYSTEPPAARDAQLVALPYHLWANRAPGSMQVWMAE